MFFLVVTCCNALRLPLDKLSRISQSRCISPAGLTRLNVIAGASAPARPRSTLDATVGTRAALQRDLEAAIVDLQRLERRQARTQKQRSAILEQLDRVQERRARREELEDFYVLRERVVRVLSRAFAFVGMVVAARLGLRLRAPAFW